MRLLVLGLTALLACSPAIPHRERAAVALGRGQLDEAELELRLAVAVAPRDGEAHAALGRLLLEKGQRGGALRELDAARTWGASGVDPELGKLVAARAAQRAGWRDPDRWRDWERAGKLAGDVPDGTAAFDAGEVRRLAGDEGGARRLLAKVVVRDAEGLAASRQAREAGGWQPPGCAADHTAWRRLLAAIARADGDRVVADYVDGELSRQCRAPEVAALYAGRGDFARARRWVDDALAEAPARADLALEAARLAAMSGDVPRAELYLEQAEYWSVARGRPSLALARTYLELGRLIEALGAARQAIALGDLAVREQALTLTVEAADRAGRAEDAIRARRALDLLGAKPR